MTDPTVESRLPLITSLDIYVPRDERFGHLKMSDFLGYGLKSVAQILYPALKSLFDSTPNEFDSLEDVLKLYEGGIKLPKGLQSLTDNIPFELLKEILRTDGEAILKFPTPQIIQGSLLSTTSSYLFSICPNCIDDFIRMFYIHIYLGTEDKSAWRTDEEFGREMLAGLNPVIISLLQVSTCQENRYYKNLKVEDDLYILLFLSFGP